LVVMRSEESANLGVAVQHIVAPIVVRQIKMLRRRAEFNDLKLEQKLENQPQKMRYAGFSNRDLRNYLKEAGNLLRTAKPALLIGRLDRESLLHTLSQSMDGTLFMCNELAIQGEPCPMEGNQEMELDLVQRCLNRLPIIESFGRTKVNIGEPSLGGVLIAARLSFASWFAQFGQSPVLGSSLLLLRSPAKAAMINNAALEGVSLQQGWSVRIGGLMDGWNPKAFPLQLSRQARVTLFNFHNELFDLTSRLLQPAHEMYTAPYRLATRLMIGLHLLESGSPEISEKTAAAAVMLARHYGPRQICTWKDAHANTMNGHDFPSRLVHLDAA
jgi:hypothetical protein